MSDPRTPKRYYVTEEEYLNQKTSLEKLKSKLDDLVGALDSYKEKKNASPAAKKIADNEEDKAARIRYLKRSKEFAENFVDSVICGTHLESVEKLKEALDYKAFIRADPYMRRTGATMERQLFGDKDTD
ncbi:hypothetical protein [Prochlorococcus marinus]|uniref:hypothetical protein n=1 Tax=Prochlorococcus marinus TaxID=1219 RepID=UPI0007B3B5D1|nr:hypothetical protein [Prochlorococcus marinus]KZR76732.1 hypothetical protein PMIT1320_00641 [Prochlorococcus marinus str. MIT 1320]